MISEDFEASLGRDEALWSGLRGARLFITGGTGFVGKWLLGSLAHANERLALDARAVVLSRDPRAFAAQHPHLFAAPGLEWIAGDVRTFAEPAGAFSHAIHAATDVARQVPPREAFDAIARGAERVVGFCASRSIAPLLMVSSGAVYGRQPPTLEHVPEEHPGAPSTTSPASAYGQGKRVAEWLACAEPGVSARIARCFAFVGPHLPLDGPFAIGNFIADRAAGNGIEVKGDGTAVRSYLYASDLARWLWTILLRGAPGEAYNVGSEEAIDVGALARRVAALENGNVPVRVAQAARAGVPAERYVPSTRKARSTLGLEATVPLDVAMARTLAWARTTTTGAHH